MRMMGAGASEPGWRRVGGRRVGSHQDGPADGEGGRHGVAEGVSEVQALAVGLVVCLGVGGPRGRAALVVPEAGARALGARQVAA